MLGTGGGSGQPGAGQEVHRSSVPVAVRDEADTENTASGYAPARVSGEDARVTSSSVTTADRADAARRFRTALFVDFDNVYIGLQRLDPVAAEAFATNPAHWLSELESGTDAEGDFSRRFLIRACYLNPSRSRSSGPTSRAPASRWSTARR